MKKREEQAKLEKSGVNQYYGIRAVIALGVKGGLVKPRKQIEQPSNPQQNKPHPQVIAAQPQTNKFEMD